MSRLLDMSYGTVLDYVDILLNQQSSKFSIPFRVIKSLSYLNGFTGIDVNSGLAQDVVIGINGLSDGPNIPVLNRFAKVSDLKFTTVLVNIFHESAHCEQKNVMFQQEEPSQMVLSQVMCEVACRKNPNYYRNNGNYYKNPNEIQAEFYGVMGAYDYLCDMFPDVDAKQHEQIVLDYVNHKMHNFTYYIGSEDTTFTSLSQVEQAFEQAYDRSFLCRLMYKVTDSSNKDEAKQYMDTHRDAKEAYLMQSTHVDQDMVIAAITCQLHPDMQGQYQSLSNVDLSYDTNITKHYEEYQRRRYCRNQQLNTKFGHLLESVDSASYDFHIE